MGEGILHLVKSEMKMGLRPGWQKRLLLRLLRAKALASIMDSLGMDDVVDIQGDDGDDDDDDEAHDDTTIRIAQRGSYHRYKSMGDIYAAIASRKPVSVVQLDSWEFRAVVGKLEGPDQLVALSFVAADGAVTHGGLHYWIWKAGVEAGDLDPDTVARSVLLLPLLVGNREDRSDRFAAVSTVWEEMDGTNGRFVTPPQLGPEPSNE